MIAGSSLSTHRHSSYKNGRAKVPDLLRLSSSFGESYEQISNQIQTLTDEGSYSCYGSARFSGVADGCIACSGDDCSVLAGDGP